jgi:hypothetical protein
MGVAGGGPAAFKQTIEAQVETAFSKAQADKRGRRHAIQVVHGP